MSCFSMWITLLILIGSAWSQTIDTEPSARSLKFGFVLVEPIRAQFCRAYCKNLTRFLFLGNASCRVNCPELWVHVAATTMPPSTTTKATTPTTVKPTTSTMKSTTAAMPGLKLVASNF